MLVYIPVTNLAPNAPLHDTKEIESTKAILRKAKHSEFCDSIHYNGKIYNGEFIFKNPDGVNSWWNDNFETIKETELKAENIEWMKVI